MAQLGPTNVYGSIDITGKVSAGTGGYTFADTNGYLLSTDTTGLYWNTTDNQVEFRGAGTNRLDIDVDTGNLWTTGTISADGITSDTTLAVTGTSTFTGDATFSGRLNVRGHLDLSDNEYLYFGSGDDVEFFCNGSHMYTDLNSGIGNWYIRDGSTTRFTFDDAGHFTATGTLSGATVTSSGSLTGAQIGVSNTSNTSGKGLSLYSGAETGKPAYGLMFGGTATFGTHGSVAGDWATYFTMSGATDRGWVFQHVSSNVASISGTGNLATNGHIQPTGGIKFVANSSDSASINTTVSGSATYLDFNLTDDLSAQDRYRWRFTPTGGSVYSLAELYVQTATNNDARFNVNGQMLELGNRVYSPNNKGNIGTGSTNYAAGNHTHSYLSNSFTSTQDASFGNIHWTNGANYIQSDARWNENGMGTNTASLHFWGTTAAGATYGKQALALYSGSKYSYISGENDCLRITTNNNTTGYIEIGPKNSSYAHIYTDRSSFYFNKNILVNGTSVSLSGHTHSYVPLSTGGNIVIHADSDSSSASEYMSLKAGKNELRIKSNGSTTSSSGLLYNGSAVYHDGNKNIGTTDGTYAEGSHGHSNYLTTSGKAADSDKLDGYNSGMSVVTANTVPVRNGSGDIYARLFRSTYANQTTVSGALAFRVNSSSDNYVRFCSSTSAIRTWLGVSSGTGTTITRTRIYSGNTTSGTISISQSLTNFDAFIVVFTSGSQDNACHQYHDAQGWLSKTMSDQNPDDYYLVDHRDGYWVVQPSSTTDLSLELDASSGIYMREIWGINYD